MLFPAVQITCNTHCRKSKKLSDFFNLLSITPDKTGQDYISIIEAKQYPFLAVQFHPEQPCFEFHNPEVPHSTNAVRLSQALSLAFAEVCSTFFIYRLVADAGLSVYIAICCCMGAESELDASCLSLHACIWHAESTR